MKKNIAFLLMGLSLLALALVISLGQISLSIKMAASGNISFGSATGEIPILVYFMIIVVIFFSFYLLICKDRN